MRNTRLNETSKDFARRKANYRVEWKEISISERKLKELRRVIQIARQERFRQTEYFSFDKRISHISSSVLPSIS